MRRAALAACAALLAASAPAAAQPAAPDPRAEALNEQGKALYLDKQDYAGAVAKFRAAIAIRADARYAYNLCAALDKLGQLEEALEACDQVFALGARQDLAEKTGRRAAEIRKAMKAKKEGPTSAPATPAETPAPAPSGSDAARSASMYDEAPAYGWGLGADLGIVHNANVGDTESFARNGLGLRLHGDFVLAPKIGLGLEPYLHMTFVGERTDVSGGHGLSIFELGAAATWTQPLWRSLSFVAAGGLAFAALSTSTMTSSTTSSVSDSYGTISLRLDAGLEWTFEGGQHVVSFVPVALTIYPAAIGQLGGVTTSASVYGLDRGGLTWGFLVGYRIRFKGTLLPLLNLE